MKISTTGGTIMPAANGGLTQRIRLCHRMSRRKRGAGLFLLNVYATMKLLLCAFGGEFVLRNNQET